MRLAVSFTNLGPYHHARLRALGARLGVDLIVYETAGAERKYPWVVSEADEPFRRVTLHPDRALEAIPAAECRARITEALDRDRPDVLALAGYVRPEVLAALAWAGRRRCPVVLMSESGAIDRPRVWWREAVKRRRLRRVHAALVGGPPHREYLVALGIPADRITLGYNAVDSDGFALRAEHARADPASRIGLPERPYLLAVSRFAPEKNLPALVRAFDASGAPALGFDLVLAGSGPEAPAIAAEIHRLGLEASVHRPGFLQVPDLPRWYAHASAFVLPSLSEPWGLVANEAAASGLPLLVSDRAGCAPTLVPEAGPATGRRFDPTDPRAFADALRWACTLTEPQRREIGHNAARVALAWGPERFADGLLEAVAIARSVASRRRPEVATS